VFYGWYIVFAGLILTAYNEWATFYGFTAFVEPVAATFGWSYAQISLATSFRSLLSGALSPFLGMSVDRWSPKKMALIGVITLGFGYFLFSRITSLTTLYLSVLFVGLGGSLCYMVPTTTIVRWFKKNVGKAIAILSLGAGLGGSLMPLLVKMIDSYGWQTSLVILSIGIGVIGIPISFIFRTRPEDYGLLPDGQRQEDLKDATDATSHDFSVSAREALKMRSFWQMSIAFMLRFPAVMAVLTHIMPYLTRLGVEKATASMVVMIIPLSSLAGRIPFGWLADIFPKKYISAIAMMLTTVSLLLFWLIDGSVLWLMILFAIIFGLGVSGFVPLRAPLLRAYFGTRKFATISGLTGLFSMIGMFIGPPFAGWVFDTLGVYDPAWLILAAVVATAVILMLMMPRPPEIKDRP
jgi:sugar phosphate permease